MANFTDKQIADIADSQFIEAPHESELLKEVIPSLMTKVNALENAEVDAALPTSLASANVTYVDPGTGFLDGFEDVQSALDQINAVVSIIDASGIPFDPAGSIEATDVQAAIEEVDSDVTALGDYIFIQKVSSILNGNKIPAEPADGFRVFCTDYNADPLFYEGKIYTYTTANGWDAGVNLGAGRAVTSVDGDIIVGGNGLTAYQILKETDDADEVEYDATATSLVADNVQAAIDEIALYAYPVTVINTSATGTHADDDTLIGGRIVSIVPVSGAESAVKASSVTAQGGISLELVEAQAAGDAVFTCYCQKLAPVA